MDFKFVDKNLNGIEGRGTNLLIFICVELKQKKTRGGEGKIYGLHF